MINKSIFNIKTVIYLIQMNSINFHTRFFNIVKTTKFNILIIYYNYYYFKTPYAIKEIIKMSNFIDELLKISITKIVTKKN